jgi:hypothetical protein
MMLVPVIAVAVRGTVVRSADVAVAVQLAAPQVGHHEAGKPVSICRQAICLAPGTRLHGGRANKVPGLKAV